MILVFISSVTGQFRGILKEFTFIKVSLSYKFRWFAVSVFIPLHIT